MFTGGLIAAMLLGGSAASAHQAALPTPSAAPLTLDLSRDPVLTLARREAGWPALRAAVSGAIERQPGIGEYAATEDEARAALRAAERLSPPGPHHHIVSAGALRWLAARPECEIELTRRTGMAHRFSGAKGP